MPADAMKDDDVIAAARRVVALTAAAWSGVLADRGAGRPAARAPATPQPASTWPAAARTPLLYAAPRGPGGSR